MNKVLVLQIGLFVSFAHLNGMETVKGLLGMNRVYSCDYALDKKKNEVAVKIVDAIKGDRAFWFSKNRDDHDMEKGIFTIVLSSSDNTRPTIKIEGECAINLMKAVVTKPSVIIQTVLPGTKKPMLWEVKGDGIAESREMACNWYKYQTNNALKSSNKHLNTIAIGSEALQKGDIEAKLQIPYSFNPFGSVEIHIQANPMDKNMAHFSMNSQATESLLHLSAIMEKTNSAHSNIKISYTKEDDSSEKTAFLNREIIAQQLQSYFFKCLWIKRGILGFSVTIAALLAYFKFNQK